MKFEEALKLLKEGKKIRRKTWASGITIKEKDDLIVGYNGGIFILGPKHLRVDDWEEYKEEDNWNWRFDEYQTIDTARSVKKLQQKILEDIEREFVYNGVKRRIKEIIKKRFGFEVK